MDVVDRLQPIEVAEQQRQRLAVVAVAPHGSLQPLVEGAPVGEPGQRVLVGEPRDAGEELGPADRGTELARHRLEEAHVLAAEGGGRRVGRRPERPPEPVLAVDRDAQVGGLLELAQQRRARRVAVGIVERVEVGLTVPGHLGEAGEVRDLVDLVVGAGLLDRAQGPDVDHRPEQTLVLLELADRERRSVERRQRLRRRQLEQLVEVAGSGGRRGEPEQGLALPVRALARRARLGAVLDRSNRRLRGRRNSMEGRTRIHLVWLSAGRPLLVNAPPVCMRENSTLPSAFRRTRGCVPGAIPLEFARRPSSGCDVQEECVHEDHCHGSAFQYGRRQTALEAMRNGKWNRQVVQRREGLRLHRS